MKSRFKKLSHSIYECKYHIVMCPKYRHRIFKDDVAEYAKQQLYSLCRQKDLVEVLELNVKMTAGVLGPPSITKQPTNDKIKQIIIIIGILSLMAGVFFVFFLDYIERMKARENNKNED